ncbi:MAG: TIGR00266 family protein [Bacteroidales bacterium]|nr:TIGR00266 family protein [Bacteroidales bacterium]
MKITKEGGPAFAYIHVDLEPGEKFRAEADAMTSMSAELHMKAKFNGGFFSAFIKKWFGKESLFINEFTNPVDSTKRVTITQGTPGDIVVRELKGDSVCMQPGAYVASTTGIKLGVRWAGFTSWIAREGLLKLVAKGEGTVIIGAFGALVEKDVADAYIVDTGHLVAYDPALKLKLKLAGGLFSSMFGGEGLVTKLEGKGKVVMQSRSIEGIVGWTNKFLR